jgi:hypothetical protein
MYLNHDVCRKSTLFNVYSSVTNTNNCLENTCCTRCTVNQGIVTDTCDDLNVKGVDYWKARFVFESDPGGDFDITSKDNNYVA